MVLLHNRLLLLFYSGKRTVILVFLSRFRNATSGLIPSLLVFIQETVDYSSGMLGNVFGVRVIHLVLLVNSFNVHFAFYILYLFI